MEQREASEALRLYSFSRLYCLTEYVCTIIARCKLVILPSNRINQAAYISPLFENSTELDVKTKNSFVASGVNSRHLG